jgi:hypothetical protein
LDKDLGIENLTKEAAKVSPIKRKKTLLSTANFEEKDWK